MAYKLGRKAAVRDLTVPHLHTVLPATAIVPTKSERYTQVKTWPMLMNDQLGDCTIAGVGHILEYWNVVAHKNPATMTDPEAEEAYEIIGGYIPGNASTDNGCVEVDVLKYFKNHGILAAGKLHKISNYLFVSPKNLNQVKQSIYHLGNCYFGYNLPSNAMQTTLWSVDPNAQIEGGHAINAVGYDDEKKLLYIVSWGEVVPVTYDFHQTYCEEAWSLYSTDWTALKLD